MTHTYNKKLLFLFFLLPTTMQCMKRSYSQINNTPKLTTNTLLTKIQTLADKRNEVMPSQEFPYVTLIVCDRHLEPSSNQCNNACLTSYRNFTFNGYSLLGLATMSIPVQYRPNCYMLTELSSYDKKANCIKQLLNSGFKPTEKDKEIASIEKYERSLSKISLLYCANKDNKNEYNQHWLSQIPHELIEYITLLTFNTTESLF